MRNLIFLLFVSFMFWGCSDGDPLGLQIRGNFPNNQTQGGNIPNEATASLSDDSVSLLRDSVASLIAVFDNDILPVAKGPYTVIIDGCTNGTCTLNSSGIEFTPNPSFLGNAEISYRVVDAEGTISNTATVAINVNLGSAPVVVNDTESIVYNKTSGTIFNPLVNDTDADGDLVSALIFNPSDCVSGWICLANGASLEITPVAAFSVAQLSNTFTFPYSVADQLGNTSSGTLTVSLDPGSAPLAVDDTSSGFENLVQVSSVTDNDIDTENDLIPTTVMLVGNSTDGNCNVALGDSIQFSPNIVFIGTTTCTYTVADDVGQVSNTATVTFTVNAGAGSAPVANNDAGSMLFYLTTAQSFDVLGNDTDVDNDIVPSSLTVTSCPTGWSCVPNGNSIDVTLPTISRSLVPLTDTVTYSISDTPGNGPTTASLSVMIISGSPLVTVNDSFIIPENSSVQSFDVLDNDIDTDDDIDGTTLAIAVAATNGTCGVSNGDLTYVPNSSFVGADTCTYEVNDRGLNGLVQGQVTFNIIPVGSPPVAVADTSSGFEGVDQVVDVLANDTDPDNDIEPSSLQIDTNSADGTCSVNSSNHILFVPNASFSGVTTCTYTVKDLAGNSSNIGTVTFTVMSGSGSAPTLVADNPPAQPQGVTHSVDVLLNDTDADGDLDPSTLVISANSSSGTCSINGSNEVEFVPLAPFFGTTTCDYSVSDVPGNTSTATVTFVVNQGSAPTVVDDTPVDQAQGVTQVIDVLANDSDVDGNLNHGSLTITGASSDGTCSTTAANEVQFIPNASFVGLTSCEYTVGDTAGNTSSGTVFISVGSPCTTTEQYAAARIQFESFNSATGDLVVSNGSASNSSIGIVSTSWQLVNAITFVNPAACTGSASDCTYSGGGSTTGIGNQFSIPNIQPQDDFVVRMTSVDQCGNSLVASALFGSNATQQAFLNHFSTTAISGTQVTFTQVEEVGVSGLPIPARDEYGVDANGNTSYDFVGALPANNTYTHTYGASGSYSGSSYATMTAFPGLDQNVFSEFWLNIP